MNKKLHKILALFSLCSLLGLTGYSTSLTAKPYEVYLKSLLAEKLDEKFGDEIYVSITQYSNKRPAQEFSVPNQPMAIQILDNKPHVVNKLLWSNEVLVGEKLELLISVIEQDIAPLDVDDHIGSVKLHLEEKHGGVISYWSIPDLKDQTEVTSVTTAPTFNMSSKHGIYVVEFAVQT